MLLRAFAVVLSLMVLAAPAVAEDATLKGAEAYVDKVIKDAFDTIGDARAKEISNADAKVKFRKILNSSFDIPTIAKFTMGRYWRVATPAEKKEYTDLLKTVILEKYADRLLSFSGDGYTIDSSRALNDKDVAVATTIKPANEPPVSFGWRLRKVNGGFKVIDLSVEGVSMSVTHRTDFGSVIERNGGKVQALIDALKQKKTASKS